MAEALGIASGLTALVTIAAQLTKLSYTLITDIKNASRIQKQYLQEVSALTDVLLRAESASEAASRLGLDLHRPDNLTSGVLSECGNQLLSLKADLEGGFKRICWPLRERETKRQIEQLQRFQSILSEFLSANILATSAETYRSVQESSRQDAKDRFLQWLDKHVAPSNSLPEAFSATGKWFVEGSTFTEWAEKPPSIMWMRGAPGSGKSMLSSIVVRHLQDSAVSTAGIVAYFFCDYSSRKQQGTAAILLNILRQFVADGEDSLAEPLQNLRKTTSREPTVAEVSEMLVLAITLVSKPFLVIDALDEIENASALVQLLPKFVKAGCTVFITSRSMPGLERMLADATCVELKANAQDLRMYIKARLEVTHPAAAATKNGDLVDAIAERTGGIFLLARIFVEHLLDLTTVKQMRKALPALPTHLGEAYKSSSRRIDEQPPARRSLAYRVIAWVTHAARRLTGEEMVHAFAVEDGDDELDTDNIIDMQLVLHVCVGLVILHPADRTLAMVHTTAHEYFQGSDAGSAHEDMASTCLTYLRLQPLLSGPCANAATMNSRLEDMQFLDYAAKHFAGHIHEGGAEEKLSSSISDLLASTALRAAAWQVSHYRPGLTDAAVADELLSSIPHSQSPAHLAAFWGLRCTLASLLDRGYGVCERDSQDWTPLHWACRQESLEAVELLISRGADVNAKDSAGWSPMFWFAFKGNSEGVQMLLRNRADHRLLDTHNWTPLHWALSAQQMNVVNVLLAHDGTQGTKDTAGPCFPSSHGSATNDAKTGVSLSKHALSVARFDDASAFNPYELLAGKDVNFSPEDLQEILSGEVLDPPAGNLWRTLKKAERMFFSDSGLDNDERIFRRALRESDTSTIQGLIANGIRIDHPDRQGLLPLHQAILVGSFNMAFILLQAGADPNAMWYRPGYPPEDSREMRHCMAFCELERARVRSPLMLACGIKAKHSKHPTICSRMVALLLSFNADVHLKDNLEGSVLHYAAVRGDLDLVTRLINAGVDIDARHESGMKASHCAAESGSSSLAGYLIDVGVDYRETDRRGRAPIHYWARAGSHRYDRQYGLGELEVGSMLSLLVASHGIDMLSMVFKYKGSHSPLSLALEAENWPVVKLLLQARAMLPTDCSAEDRATFLTDAVRYADRDIVQTLLGYCTDVDLNAVATGTSARCRSGWHFFFNPGRDVDLDLAQVQILQRGGMRISVNQNEILSNAIRYGAPRDAIGSLLSLGADACDIDPRIKGDMFISALLTPNCEALESLVHHALQNPRDGHWTAKLTLTTDMPILNNVCRALRISNTLDNHLDGARRTILWRSSETGDLDLCRELIRAGANVQQEDEHGWNPLHAAAYHGHDEVVETLLLSGADPRSYTEKWPSASSYYWLAPWSWQQSGYWRAQAIHLAAFRRHVSVVKTLLAHGKAETGALMYHQERGETAGNDAQGVDGMMQHREQTALELVLHLQDTYYSRARMHAEEVSEFDEFKAVLDVLLGHGPESSSSS